MQITINGEEFFFDKILSISELADYIKIDKKSVAIERNLAIIPRSEYDLTNIAEGDSIEIVKFMGGG